MKRKLVLRTLTGFPIGITISYIITILISALFGDGRYLPCVPELSSAVGSEIRAVFIQALLSGLMGAGFGASSLIWETDKWSIAAQTGIYFGLISVIMLPIAYLMYWMEHSAVGFLSYFGIFVFIFIVVWLLQFIIGRRTVKKMNASLRRGKGAGEE